MNYGWIKIEEVINQVKSELKTLNEQGKILSEDCLQWAVDALRDIGTPNMFDEQWALVPIKNHTGVIPNDVYLVDVAYKLTKGDFTNYIQPIITTELTLTTLNESDIKKIISLALPLKYGGTDLKLFLNNNQNINVTSSESFILQGRRVVTSYKEGLFLMSFMGLYLDEDGLPMVPDDIDTVNAIKAYIRYMLFTEPFYMREEGAQGPYLESKEMWYNMRARAQNNGVLPGISEAIERVNETANRYWKFRLPKTAWY